MIKEYCNFVKLILLLTYMLISPFSKIMQVDKEIEILKSKFWEMTYCLYQKEIKNGVPKNEILKRLSVGKSAQKAKAFQQTALMFDK